MLSPSFKARSTAKGNVLLSGITTEFTGVGPDPASKVETWQSLRVKLQDHAVVSDVVTTHLLRAIQQNARTVANCVVRITFAHLAAITMIVKSLPRQTKSIWTTTQRNGIWRRLT